MAIASTTEPLSGPDLTVRLIRGDRVAWLVLEGESDLSTRDQLRAAIDQVDLGGAASVHLDLSHLVFADAATIRQLTRFTRDAARGGRRVTTSGANPVLRQVAHLFGLEGDLGPDRSAATPAP